VKKTTNLIIDTTGYPVNSKLPRTIAWIMTKLTLQDTTVDIARIAFIGLPPIISRAFPFPVGIMRLKSKRSRIVSFPGEISVIQYTMYRYYIR